MDEIQERLVSMVRAAAVRRARHAIDLLRQQLVDAERALDTGRAPDARNMGQHLADLAESAGVLGAIRDMDLDHPAPVRVVEADREQQMRMKRRRSQ